jgi:hypothetical protein
MVTLDNTLERIAMSFTVRDIMIQVDRLVKVPDEASAKQLSRDRAEFDVIPIYKNGEIVKYLEKGKTEARFVSVADTISDATSILDAVDILKHRRFGFVLGGNKVVGYLHFSDLNNSIVKIPFYVMFEALEYALVQKIQNLITDDNLGLILDPERHCSCTTKMKRLRKNNTDAAWTSLLYFSEILASARHFEKVSLEDQEISILANIRNRVDHATDPLIRDFSGIERLAQAKLLSLNLLKVL